MARYFSLPSIYLGSHTDGETLYKNVQSTYEANRERFNSNNAFLKHLLAYALEHDLSLKKPVLSPEIPRSSR